MRKDKGRSNLERAEPKPPDISLTPEEWEASRRVHDAIKPELDRVMAKLSERLSRPIRPLDETTPRSGLPTPNVYYRCVEHGLPLDPWGLCHHGCARCDRESPFQRIWKHKGSCRPKTQQLVNASATR